MIGESKENLHFDNYCHQFFSFFSSQCFQKAIENVFSAFLSTYKNTRESLGELEKAVETLAWLWLAFPQPFSFSKTSTRVSITRWKNGTCFLFLKLFLLIKTTK